MTKEKDKNLCMQQYANVTLFYVTDAQILLMYNFLIPTFPFLSHPH